MASVERTRVRPFKRCRVSSGSSVRSGLRSFERLTRYGKAGFYAKQDAKRKVQTALYEGMGREQTEGLNAQYREVLGRYPSKAEVRSVGANGAWKAKCRRQSVAGSYSVFCKAAAIPGRLVKLFEERIAVFGLLRACEKIPSRLRAPLNMSDCVAGTPISGHAELATLPDIGTPAPCRTRPAAPSLRAGIFSHAMRLSKTSKANLAGKVRIALALT